MDVFSAALETGFLRDAAIAAAYELGLLGADATRPVAPTRRMHALLDLLDALGVLGGPPPPCPDVPREGWGRLAAVIRSDRPLAIDPVHEHGSQRHLLSASAPAAAELVARLPAWFGRAPASLLDLGGGAGAYTAAFLDAYPGARATLVDRAEVVALARDHLARFEGRVTFIEGDARAIDVGRHDVALLANVLHLHGPDACRDLCAAAARTGDLVVVKDLRRDTLQGRFFALGMAIYTDGGDVYAAEDIRRWLPELVSEHRLENADEGLVLTAIGRPAELADPAIPPGFARVLARALTHVAPGKFAATILAHYTVTMPARRAEQLALPIFHGPLDWQRLPRLSAAIDRLNAILVDAGVPPVQRAPTLAALYERTYYGRLMPLLYGDAHLQRVGDPHAVIDTYLVAPLMHELCHLGPERPPIDPPHLDECIGGWLAIHVHAAFGEPDAIYGAPWLAQVGQAIARAFGIRAVVRAHAGLEPLPAWFTRGAEQIGWQDWIARRSLHLLADTMDPVPWVDLARSRGLPPDQALDRLVVRDALRAMCLGGRGLEVEVAVPDESVRVVGGWMTTSRVRYWVPIAGEHELRIGSLDEIDAITARLCSA